MKFIKQKLTKEQCKNRDNALKEIKEVLKKYPYNTPILIIWGHKISLDNNDLDLSDISHYNICGCNFINNTKK